jgi:uncharacterized membrane protein YeaQ/YmgE (transglycosylase-associated protein family)
MYIVWMLIIGLVAGALAKLIMPGRQGGGWGITMLLGVAGALVAGLVGRMVGFYDPDAGEGPGILAATIGAVAVLAIYFAVANRRSLPH